MIPPEAINQFTDRQKRLLRRTYDDAWQTGVDGYQPDDDPEQEPDEPRGAALAGLTGAALLAARRRYRYLPPSSPDPVRRAVALAPAFSSLNSMSAELAVLHPSEAVLADAADQIASAGDAFARAILDWVASNGHRLDGGASVAWSGEQAGYGEAADVDGQLLQWELDDAANHCEDCPALADLPPQPLSEWPCVPGDGSTQCDVGCRCGLDAIEISIQPGDTYAPQLSGDQEALVGKLMDAQAQAMAAMLPDAQYLD